MKYNVIFCTEDISVISEIQIEEDSLYELLYRLVYDALISQEAVHISTEEQ